MNNSVSPENADKSKPGFKHLLETALFFGLLGGLADASYVLSQHLDLAADFVETLHFFNTACILTFAGYFVCLAFALIAVRTASLIFKWNFETGLRILYFLAALPAGALIAWNVAGLVNSSGQSGLDINNIYFFLKYAWVTIPAGWGIAAWLARIRVNVPYSKLASRVLGFVMSLYLFLVMVPNLQSRFISADVRTISLTSNENLILSAGVFLLAALMLPLFSWIIGLLAKPMKGGLLTALWIVATALPFIPCIIHGAPTTGTQPSGATLTGRNSNVILVSIDTARVDDFGIYGSEIVQTPNIDALGESGTVFDNAVTPMPMTGPAHMSMLTGLQPDRTYGHGVQTNGMLLPENIPTLATILDSAGYGTAAVIGGSPLVREASGLQRGFHYYNDNFKDDLISRLSSGYSFSLTVTRIYRTLSGKGWVLVKKPADKITDQAVEWLGSNSSRPFFMFLHYYDPHTPLDPPDEWKNKFAVDEGAPVSTYADDFPISVPDDFNIDKLPFSEELTRERRTKYRGEIGFVDQQLGRLFDYCRENGLMDNTLIIVTADHGEAFDSYYYGHINRLYNAIVHVPLIICDPDAAGDSRRIMRTDELVNISDIYFTVLDYLEVEPPVPASQMNANIPGNVDDWNHSLLTIIRPPFNSSDIPQLSSPTAGWLFVPMITHGPPTPNSIDIGRSYAFRFTDSCLILSPGGPPYYPEYQYFDLASDPRQMINTYWSVDWTQMDFPTAPEDIASWASMQGITNNITMDPAIYEQLRALGYLQ